MKIKLALCLLGLVVAGLVGCVNPPTETELQTADFGPAPTGHTADIVRAFMAYRLKDPNSAQYRFPETLDRYWLKGGVLSGKGTVYGFRALVQINAKNGYGGYTGYEPYAFLIRDGRVIAYSQGDMSFWQSGN